MRECALHLESRWKFKPGHVPVAGEQDQRDDQVERPLVCARCGHEITSSQARIEVAGLHQHSQVNPHGYIWEFRCFSSAPGCVGRGPFTGEFSWFAGMNWQLAHCAKCQLHLGWRFESASGESSGFHGLIVLRVVEP